MVLLVSVAACFTLGTASATVLPQLTVPILTREPSMGGRIDASWNGAVRIALAFDYTNRRKAAHHAIAFVAQDANGLDVAFMVRQTNRVTATTRSNGSGVFGDDNVEVTLYPQGTKGFSYQFTANARGVRFQSSSENTSYAPQWVARGTITKSGYTVTMHIPFAIIRAGGAHRWKAQFARFVLHTNSLQVWSYDPNATSPVDPIYAGTLLNVMSGATTKRGKLNRPKPRFQPYLLGVARSSAAGGSTSQMGLDMALPITPTASFVGSLHPDYSNVEIDQQTISPTAFPRQYQEVRPFFTQVGNAFNYIQSCINCPQLMYTPSIPTFRQGYGVEGTQGPLTFAGFDAIGFQRTDAAGAVDYNHVTKRYSYRIDTQRIEVSTPNLLDTTTSLNGGYSDQRHHWFVYGNYAREDGSGITNPIQAHYGEVGGGYQTANTFLTLARQFIGDQFNPVDGYLLQNDIGGDAMNGGHTFHFSPKSKIQAINLDIGAAKFWNHLSQPAQENATYQVSVGLKDLWSFEFSGGSSNVLTSAGEFLPFNGGNGALVGYNVNSNYPVEVAYSSGAYYHGNAASWQFLDAFRAQRRLSFSVALNENIYSSGRITEPSFREWLNSVSTNWQLSRDAQLSLGVRRINGISLPTYYFTPTFSPVFADNLSAAFHYLHGHNEFYVVYGNPNGFITTPAVYFKWIFYAGAGKGS